MIRNIIYVLNKFGVTFLFVILELFCLYTLVNFNNHQKVIWANSSNLLVGNINKRYNKVVDYINLDKVNEDLIQENARLKKQVLADETFKMPIDSMIASNFEFIPSLVINNSVSKTNNYFTLNKGSKDGVEKGMGVITSSGVAGVVLKTSRDFALVNSVLNQQSRISAILEKNSTLGTVKWDGKNPNYVTLESIPQYVDIQEGDTVVTSGYSIIFPRGEMIGLVSDFEKDPNTGFYNINLELASDMSALEMVYVVKNPVKEDIESLENKVDE